MEEYLHEETELAIRGNALLLLSLTGCRKTKWTAKASAAIWKALTTTKVMRLWMRSRIFLKNREIMTRNHRKLYGKGEQPLRRTDGQLGHNL